MNSELTDGGMVDDGQKEGLVYACIYTYICIWKEGWVHARMMDGWRDGPTDGWKDGWRQVQW